MAEKSTTTGSTDAAFWVTPEEPVPVRLMNTIWADRSGVHDALHRREDLSEWLRVVGLTTARIAVTRDDLLAALRARDALRRLTALVTEDTRPAAASATNELDEAIHEINAIAAAAPGPRLLLSRGILKQGRTPTSRQAPAALASVATEAIDLLTGPRAGLLRACYAPGCVLYFVKDHPRREWCSTACGNRARAARHYARHTGKAPTADPGVS